MTHAAAVPIVVLALTLATPPVPQDLRPTAVAVAAPTEPFTSNGCSGFREARFFSCCYVHDFAFWAGGNRHDRNQADLQLRRCVADISNRLYADMAYLLMKLGQIAGTVVDDGWGRAWRGTGRKRFAELTPGQAAVVVREHERVCQSLRLNPATGKYRVDETREIRPQEAKQVCLGKAPPR